jgi:hypothetical protein
MNRRNFSKKLCAMAAAVALPVMLSSGGPGASASGPSSATARDLERAAADWIRRNYRLTVRSSTATNNLRSVYVVAYRPGVGGPRTFRFLVREVNRRLTLVTPPTQV